MLDLPFDDRQIDLWYVFSEKIDDPRVFDEYRRRLPREEVEREQRFVFEDSRLQYLLSRALVRTVLSHYTGNDFRAWEFTKNAYGKPSVAVPAGLPFEFNLSHTSGLVACGVSLRRDLGVDVEDLASASDNLHLARRYFAAAEADVLETLPPERQPAAFLRFWTLKEAFIKARGMGLSIPLDDFAFSLDEDRPPAISFRSHDRENPANWQFAQLRVDSRYQIALAIHLPVSESLRVRVRRTVPLRWQSDAQVLPPSPSNEWSL